MSRIELFYKTFILATQTVAHTLNSFQGIKTCVKYLASHPHQPIFNPSKYFVGSNFIRITWIGNQVEDHTTHYFWNVIKMQIIPELSTEDGHVRILYML